MEKLENCICLDSDILIDLLRNKKETLEWLKENENKFIFATTIINVFELYAGAYNSENQEKRIKAVKKLIEKLKILNINLRIVEEAGKHYAKLKKEGQIIDNRDLFIGVIALTENIPLKTNNKSHFSRIDGLLIK